MAGRFPFTNTVTFGGAPIGLQNYLSEQMSAVQDSINRTQALFGGPNPTSDEWRTEVRTEMQIWKTAAATVSSLCPPPRYQEVHSKVTEAMQQLDGAADDFLAAVELLQFGIPRSDTAEISRATDRLKQGLAKMGAVAPLLEEALRLLQASL